MGHSKVATLAMLLSTILVARAQYSYPAPNNNRASNSCEMPASSQSICIQACKRIYEEGCSARVVTPCEPPISVSGNTQKEYFVSRRPEPPVTQRTFPTAAPYTTTTTTTTTQRPVTQRTAPPTRATTEHHHEHHHHEHHDHGEPYQFRYDVQSAEHGTDFTHQAQSSGDVVKGEYRVLLPDGRQQVVTYDADWKKGFIAKVSTKQ